MKTIPSEVKNNSSVVIKLTKALRSAELMVDGEIKDIDRWIGQLEAQIEHLRGKREKLVNHKADIGKSLVDFSKTANPAKARLSTEDIPQSRGNGELSAFNYSITNRGNPGESPLFSFTDQSTAPNLPEVKDERYFMPLAPTPPESTETLNGCRIESSLSTVEQPDSSPPSPQANPLMLTAQTNRLVATTRRKNLKPIRRIDSSSTAVRRSSSSDHGNR